MAEEQEKKVSQDTKDTKDTEKKASPEAAKQMQDLWTELKSAEDKNSNRGFVPLFLIICFAIIIVVLIRRHIKAKRDIF